LEYVDAYLDDFMLLAQQPQHLPTLNKLLYHLSTIFHDPMDSPQWPVMSQSKIKKGYSMFSTKKCILGWDINSHDMTLQLPPHHITRLKELLHTFLNRNYTTKQQWQVLIGELRSMTLALHSSAMLFSIVQHKLHTPA
jgi:hypothetical protein